MSAFELTRRATLVACVAVAASHAAARTAHVRLGPFGGIRVDVAPLLEHSGEPTAGWVEQTLPAAISQALAAVGRSGTPVSVTIDYVILGPSQGGTGPAGSSPDQMIGVVTIGGVERPLRASTSYYPNPVDNTMIAQSNYNRVAQLSQAFADWVARES